MSDNSKELERIGNYYLLQSDSAYEMFSGLTYLVFHQPPTFCQPKQMRGFSKAGLEQAKAYLRKVATAGVEDRKFEATKRRVVGALGKGLIPCQHEDREMGLSLRKRGYIVDHVTSSHIWYAPPTTKEASLF